MIRPPAFALAGLCSICGALAAAGAGGEAGFYRDYSARFPWFPPPGGELSESERAGMDRLRAMPRYNPKPIAPTGSGATAEQLDALEARVAVVLRLQVDPASGALSGRPMTFTGEGGAPQSNPALPANFAGDFYPLVSEAAKLYQNSRADARAPVPASVRNRAREMLRRLATHLANQPWDGAASAHPPVWIGNGYGWRDRDGGMGLRLLSLLPLLEKPAERAQYLENLYWMQGGVGAARYSGLSTDDYVNVSHQCLAAVSLMQDSPAKRQRLGMMRHAVETSVLRPTAHGTLSADGGVIHHGYAHNAYAAYEFGPLCRLLRDLAAAGAPNTPETPECVARLYTAGRAWAWIHQPGRILTNIEGRPVVPLVEERKAVAQAGGAQFAADAAATALALGLYEPTGAREVEAAGLARAKSPGSKKPEWMPDVSWSAALAAPSPLTGNLPFPVAGASVHRRDDWVVAVRGTSRHRRGGEGPPYTNRGSRQSMGKLYCHGALLLVADAESPGRAPDLVSSGHAANGFDLRLLPGVTSMLVPPERHIGGYFGTDATLAAPVALDGHGVWGFRPSYAAKSCFLFDNRITSVTGEAKMKPDAGAPMVTGAIQCRHADGADDVEFFDGRPLTHPAELTLADNRPHTLLTARGHGYYFHASPETLRVHRRTQESRFYERGLILPGHDAGATWAAFNAKGATDADRAALRERFRTLTGDFTAAYWDHGVDARQDAPVAFTLLVRSGEAGLAKFAAAMESPATAPARLTVSPNAHLMYDAPSGYWGAMFYVAGQPGPAHAANAACPLLAADRPCAVILRHEPGRSLRLAVGAGEQGFPEDKDFRATSFTLTVSGKWKLAPGAPAGTRAEVSGDRTVLSTVPCDLRGVTLGLLPAG